MPEEDTIFSASPLLPAEHAESTVIKSKRMGFILFFIQSLVKNFDLSALSIFAIHL
ncbi:Hypothetical protein SynRCC307_1258 [Synechococcus sp. RCC307]|nr:Hypothetical protein SynRCC307_1258 [Synechococcus sp. RCC307]